MRRSGFRNAHVEGLARDPNLPAADRRDVSASGNICLRRGSGPRLARAARARRPASAVLERHFLGCSPKKVEYLFEQKRLIFVTASAVNRGWIKLLKEHLILGRDLRVIEHQKQQWLSENPGVRVIAENVRREPRTLLTRIGGKRVPRFSLLLHFGEIAGQQHAASSPAASHPQEDNYDGEHQS